MTLFALLDDAGLKMQHVIDDSSQVFVLMNYDRKLKGVHLCGCDISGVALHNLHDEGGELWTVNKSSRIPF